MDSQGPPQQNPTFFADADVASSTVHARGELDRHTADLLWGTIDVLIQAGRPDITLDLADLSSIDTTGITLLAALQHSLLSHGQLTIINPKPEVCAALEQGHITVQQPAPGAAN